jgi:hypothetical protein
MTYLAFIFALALACVAGMEFICLMSLETGNRRLKRRVKELEGENAYLNRKLSEARQMDDAQSEVEEEAWPELIDDSSPR